MTQPPATAYAEGEPTPDAQDGRNPDAEVDAEVDTEVDTATEPESRPPVELRPALEALLMVADEPLGEATLAAAVDHPQEAVAEALDALVAEYDATGRGFELRHVAGGWRYYTREAFAPVVEQFVLEGQQARLTQAALETLAVVAYQQPVSRSRVSAIRGVNVDGVMRTLLTRGLVAEAGHDQETGAHLYRTTSYFLERIGVSGLDELPELAPFLPGMDDFDDEQEVAAVARTVPTGSTGATGSTDEVGATGSTDEVGATDERATEHASDEEGGEA